MVKRYVEWAVSIAVDANIMMVFAVSLIIFGMVSFYVRRNFS